MSKVNTVPFPQESWKPLVTPHLVEPFPGPLCYQVPGDPLQPPVPVLLPAVGPRARLPAPQASPADQVTPPALVDPSSWHLHQKRLQMSYVKHLGLTKIYLRVTYLDNTIFDHCKIVSRLSKS